MRSLSGLVLLAGIGVGLFVYLPAPVDRNTSLDNVQRLAAATTPPKPRAEPSVASGPRSFAPGVSLTALTHRDAPSVTRPDPTGSWQTTSSNAAIDGQNRTLEPTTPESRYRLVVDLQEQLKRVGCYDGRVDGSWGGGSKYAMQSFMQRVNAGLPSDNPDYVLLSLLKSQTGKVCGACPADQTLSTGGRCVAHATVAYGQPNPQPEPQPTGASAPKEVLPWRATAGATAPAAKPLFTPLPTSVVSTEPLPGRMAIGGPKVLPPVNSVYAPQPGPAGDGSTNTAAVGPDAGVPQVSSAPAAPKPTRTSKRSRRYEGPGTPRYNLMLSLGGVY